MTAGFEVPTAVTIRLLHCGMLAVCILLVAFLTCSLIRAFLVKQSSGELVPSFSRVYLYMLPEGGLAIEIASGENQNQ
jgi:hypothetical protein